MWEMWEHSVLSISYCAVCGYCALSKFEFTGLFKLIFRFKFYKMSKYLHLQEMLLILRFCTPNVLKWPLDCVYSFIPQWFVVLYWNFDKSYSTVIDCTYTSINLMGNLAKFHQMTLKNAVNCLYTMYVNGDFSMNAGGWMEIIEISIISWSSLMTLTRLILVWLLYDLFYQIFNKIYQAATYYQSYNTSIIESISMDSPPNDKWGFGYLIGWFVGWYRWYSTNLVCLANERVLVFVWLESLFIGFYVYHSDVIAGTHVMLLI